MALGGVDRARQAALEAREAGVEPVVTTTIDAVVARTAALHLAASVPDLPACGLATADRLAEDLAPDPAPVEDGRMAVPDAPGHGVEGPSMRDAVALQTASNPDATALIDAENGEAWTYDELDDAVEVTAGRLAALGVESSDRVGVLMETRPAFARLAFACARLGATLVPLNARLAVPELQEQVRAVEPVSVVCEAETADDARELDAPVASVDAGNLPELAGRNTAEFEAANLAWSDTRALLFTSGTTGSPKAVRLTYGNVAASAVASAFRLGVLPDDRWLCPLSMYHTGGLSVVLRSALYGTTAVLTRGFDAADTLAALDDYDCTGVSLVPTMLRRLLDSGEVSDSLRFALVGGAPTPPNSWSARSTPACRSVPRTG